MPQHREEDEPDDTQEFRQERNGRRARLGGYVALATIVLAVPIALGWVGDLYRIAQTPARVDALERAQRQYLQDQQDMKESLARIEGALHITRTPKQKDQEP